MLKSLVLTVWIVWIVLLNTIPESVDGDVTLEMLLTTYTGNDRDFDNNCCDFCGFFNGDSCDISFDISINNLGGTPIYVLSTGLIQNDAESVTFGSVVGTSPNPIQMTFSSWPWRVKMVLDVYDDDSINVIGGQPELVDTYETTITHVLEANSSIAVTHYYSETGTRANNPTTLTFELKVYCNSNYYGTDCATYCQATDGNSGHYTCHPLTGDKICLDGYEDPTTNCLTETDECLSSPCLNNATCTDQINRFTCVCSDGFEGTLCETNTDECASNPCRNDATCLDEINGYTCVCPDGFEGTQCETNTYECASNPCQNDAICLDEINGYTCVCPDGFEGTLCETNTYECASNPCQNDATCLDEINGYTCVCPGGFEGTLCETNTDECTSNPCRNDATCLDEINGYTCVCPGGFEGTLCETNTDECASNPCRNDATCLDEINGYTCVCPSWYGGVLCQDYMVQSTASVTTTEGFPTTLNLTTEHVITSTSPMSLKTVSAPGTTMDTSAKSPAATMSLDLTTSHEASTVRSSPSSTTASPVGLYSTTENLLEATPSTFLPFTTEIDALTDTTPDIRSTTQEQVETLQTTSQSATFDFTTDNAEISASLGGHTYLTRLQFSTDEPSNGVTTVVHPLRTEQELATTVPVFRPTTRKHTTSLETTVQPSTTVANVVGTESATLLEDQTQSTISSSAAFTTHRTTDASRSATEPVISLTTASEACGSQPCQNGGVCSDVFEGYECSCPLGFVGADCELIDLCIPSPCYNGAKCSMNSQQNFTCTCARGYNGALCADDIDECEEEGDCPDRSECVNSIGSYTCVCIQGFKGQECSERDFCADGPCLNNATCVSVVEKFSCECKGGYTGTRCETIIESPCQPSPCLNGGECMFGQGDGQPQCLCGQQFLGENCEIDTDIFSCKMYVEGASVDTETFKTDTANLIKSTMADNAGSYSTVEVVLVSTADYESAETGEPVTLVTYLVLVNGTALTPAEVTDLMEGTSDDVMDDIVSYKPFKGNVSARSEMTWAQQYWYVILLSTTGAATIVLLISCLLSRAYKAKKQKQKVHSVDECDASKEVMSVQAEVYLASHLDGNVEQSTV